MIKKKLQEHSDLLQVKDELENEIAILISQVKEVKEGITRIEDEMKINLKKSSKRKIEVFGYLMTLTKSKRTVIEEPDLLEEQYTKKTITADLMKIKAAINAGLTVKGAVVVESENFKMTKQKSD